MQMNLPVLIATARAWVEVFDFEAAGAPRTPPLPSLVREAMMFLAQGEGYQEVSHDCNKPHTLYALHIIQL